MVDYLNLYPRVFLFCNFEGCSSVENNVFNIDTSSDLSYHVYLNPQKDLPATDNQLFHYQPNTQFIISSMNSIIRCLTNNYMVDSLVNMQLCVTNQIVKNQMWNLIAV